MTTLARLFIHRDGTAEVRMETFPSLQDACSSQRPEGYEHLSFKAWETLDLCVHIVRQDAHPTAREVADAAERWDIEHADRVCTPHDLALRDLVRAWVEGGRR